MRAITEKAVRAFYNGENFKSGDTGVMVIDGRSALFLHGNAIAALGDGILTIQTCGWNTPDTKERLNGLRGVNVYTRKGQLYLNGQEWNGEAIKVKA